jgi:transposase
MRGPAQIKPWLSIEEMMVWVREAPTKESYRHRLSVWLTHIGPFHAQRVAELLAVSVPSVWHWVKEYNKHGPSGLEGPGSGGRRWGFLSWPEEQALLQSFYLRAGKGEIINAKKIHQNICEKLKKDISLDYVYRLLHRHGWRKIGPRPRHPKSNIENQEGFKKNFR